MQNLIRKASTEHSGGEDGEALEGWARAAAALEDLAEAWAEAEEQEADGKLFKRTHPGLRIWHSK